MPYNREHGLFMQRCRAKGKRKGNERKERKSRDRCVPKARAEKFKGNKRKIVRAGKMKENKRKQRKTQKNKVKTRKFQPRSRLKAAILGCFSLFSLDPS